MSWYKMIKEALPLPRAKYPDRRGLERVNPFVNIEETKKYFGRDEVEDPEGELDYLGHGTFGIAYDNPSDSGKAIKYTKDEEEYGAALAVMNWQKMNNSFHPVIVGVYEAEKVADGTYRIVLEKVSPLPRHFDLNEFDRKIKKEHGVSYDDLHVGNVGIRSNGDPVILDLGGLGI